MEETTNIVKGFQKKDTQYLEGFSDGLDMAVNFCKDPDDKVKMYNVADTLKSEIRKIEWRRD